MNMKSIIFAGLGLFMAIGLTSWYMAHDMRQIRERAKAACAEALARVPQTAQAPATGINPVGGVASAPAIDEATLPKGCHAPGSTKQSREASPGAVTVTPDGSAPITQDATDAYAQPATGATYAGTDAAIGADPYASGDVPIADPYTGDTTAESSAQTSGF